MTIRISLDKLLEKHGVTRYALSQQTGIKFQIIDNYYKNKVVRYDSYILLKICTVLNCDINELIELQK